MTWKDKFVELFAEKKPSETFTEAKTQLQRLREQMTTDCQTCTLGVKDSWLDMPSVMGVNAKYITLESSNDYKAILNELEPDGKIFNHKHNFNFETIQVTYGFLDVSYDGQSVTLSKGQSIKLDSGTAHSVYSKEGCSFIAAYSPNKDMAVIHNENVLMCENLLK